MLPFPLFPIDSCTNIQCSSQQPSAAAPQTVHLFLLFLIDSCMNIQCSSQQPSAAINPLMWRSQNQFFSGAFGAKCSKFFPAPSAQNVQNFLWRLRCNMFKIFSGAFGAKCSIFSLAPSEQNVKKNSPAPSAQNIHFFFSATLFSPRFARKRFRNLSALRAKGQSHFQNRFGFSETR